MLMKAGEFYFIAVGVITINKARTEIARTQEHLERKYGTLSINC